MTDQNKADLYRNIIFVVACIVAIVGVHLLFQHDFSKIIDSTLFHVVDVILIVVNVGLQFSTIKQTLAGGVDSGFTKFVWIAALADVAWVAGFSAGFNA